MELGSEVGREPTLQLLLVDLASQPGDLPGYFTVLSVLVVGRDVGDDFDANQLIQGISNHCESSLSPVDSAGQHPIPSGGQVQIP